MILSLAPFQGITDSVYRNLYKEYFTGIDKYYTPFFTGIHKDNSRSLRGEEIDVNCNDVNIVKYFIEEFVHSFRFCHETAASHFISNPREWAAHIKVYLLITHHLTLTSESDYLFSVVAQYLRR